MAAPSLTIADLDDDTTGIVGIIGRLDRRVAGDQAVRRTQGAERAGRRGMRQAGTQDDGEQGVKRCLRCRCGRTARR